MDCVDGKDDVCKVKQHFQPGKNMAINTTYWW